jgi:1,4-alpha-glucan branching enzyme
MRHEGFLCLVLHAHLPYIYHPEHEHFLEETWFYEAITETYIPLVAMFERLMDDRVDFRITLSLSPTLVEMFQNPLLRQRYRDYLETLLALTEKELRRTRGDIHFAPVVAMYYERFKKIRRLYEEVYKKDLVSVFRNLSGAGAVELITTAATHAFLPALSHYPRAIRAQLLIGSEHHREHFDRKPHGMWLPECGYAPGFDALLTEAGANFFFVDTHGILHAAPTPRFGAYLPVSCPSGAVAFGRDSQSAEQVWSSVVGYPGDLHYRDFYRDIGFDLDSESLQPCIQPDGIRTFTGLKYYRITGKTHDKQPYDREQAIRKAEEHAHHFLRSRENRIQSLHSRLGIQPVITAPYDAELFGHWWFEGPEWLEALFRIADREQKNFRMITPSEFLTEETAGGSTLQVSQPSFSSWGEKGYSEVWMNETNDYVYRHLLKATERMLSLADTFSRAEGLQQRALNQAARELLLAQQSDWTFIMKHHTSTGYARKRFEEHINRFTRLYESIIAGNISETWLSDTEQKDALFKNISYTVFSTKQQESSYNNLS